MAKLVLGAGGFIGSHLVKRLRKQGHYVIGTDLKYPSFSDTHANEFRIGDLRDISFCQNLFDDYPVKEVYQLAADMGGAGYLFTGKNDFAVMHNSAQINLNISGLAVQYPVNKIFYASSACIYPKRNQLDPLHPVCKESSAYPANPDSEYGWEKLFSERLYLNCQKNRGVSIRIGRFHNVYGPEGTWEGGREKAPAALCRKVAEATNSDQIEIWGNGEQTRSFLFIDDCLDGIEALMNSNFPGPVNIGSEEIISINDLARMIIGISGKKLDLKHIPGPTGVMGRNSDNNLAKKELNWSPSIALNHGIKRTYKWINNQVHQKLTIPLDIG